MQFNKAPMVLILASMLTMTTASAQQDENTDSQEPTAEEHRANRDARRERWENMSDEERQAARERRENMSDEERQAMRDNRRERGAGKSTDEERQARRERWESMSDEERQAMRDKRRKHREAGGKRRHRGPGAEGSSDQES